MAMPTASAAPVKAIAATRSARSFLVGARPMTTAPAAGRNTAKETADCSHPFIGRSSSQSCDHERQDGHAREQEHRVTLDVAGLHVPKGPAQAARADAEAVDGAVDGQPIERP